MALPETKHTPSRWLTKQLFGSDFFVLLREEGVRTHRLDDKGQFSREDAALIARAPDLLAENERLREALVLHNDALRSASQVADREGADTNWTGFRGTIRMALLWHHETVNEARAALSVPPPSRMEEASPVTVEEVAALQALPVRTEVVNVDTGETGAQSVEVPLALRDRIIAALKESPNDER